MAKYRIHSPWLDGREANSIIFLDSGVQKAREQIANGGVRVMLSKNNGSVRFSDIEDTSEIREMNHRDLVGFAYFDNEMLIIRTERDISKLFPAMCIVANEGNIGDEYDLVVGIGRRPYILERISHIFLADDDNCLGKLERLDGQRAE